MLPLIRRHYQRRILAASLYSFLDGTFAICASIVASWMWAVLHRLLTIFPPAITVLQMINVTFRYQCYSGVPNSLLAFLPWLDRLLVCFDRVLLVIFLLRQGFLLLGFIPRSISSERNGITSARILFEMLAGRRSHEGIRTAGSFSSRSTFCRAMSAGRNN